MAILSIQSQVSVGHAGNSAAVFPIQRLGLEVWPVNTTLLSNHRGFPRWRGFTPDAVQLADILLGIEQHGALEACRAVLVGYLGGAPQAEVIAEAVSKVRMANADALFCLDPVMGEKEAGLYVDAGIPEIITDRLLPLADILTPNPFELEYLSGLPVETLDQALSAADSLRKRGPEIVICTSYALAGEALDRVATLAVSGVGAWRVETPFFKISDHLSGTGDAFAAIFLARYLDTGSVPCALSYAVSTVYGLIRATLETDASADELHLITAQEEIVAPSICFEAETVR
jgi:pyridoxine kinase